jgi:hypothetical protein
MSLNQTAISRLRAIPAVGNFGDAAADNADTDVPVVLNGFKQVFKSFTAAEVNATDRDLIDEAALPMAVAIGNHIVDTVAALWKVAAFSNYVAVASAWTRANTVLAIRNKLASLGVTPGNQFAVFNTAVYGALLADPMIVAALNNPRNGDAITTGRLPAVDGLALDEYPALPSNSENLIGFAGAPDSTCYVGRAPKNPEEILPGAKFPGVLGYVTDPKTGFQVMVNQWIGTDLTVNNRLVWLEGCAKGNGGHGVRLVTAEPS